MPTFAFSATVSGLTNEPEQLTRLFSEALTVVPSEIDGVFSMDVHVDASSSEDAIHRFDCHLQTATPEITVVRLDEDLISTTEIAERAGAHRETARLWTTGKRREGFPAHRTILMGGVKLWAWADVHQWLEQIGKVDADEPRPLSTESVDWYNGQLVTRRREPMLATTYVAFSPDWEPLPSTAQIETSWPAVSKSHRDLYYSVSSELKVTPANWSHLVSHDR